MAKEGSVAPKERVNIVYKPATGDAQAEVELPFKMLMMGDYTGRRSEVPLEERKPIRVDKSNFNEVLAEQRLQLTTTVPNRLSPEAGGELAVTLKIQSLSDFTPDGVVSQVPELQQLLQLRAALVALKGPLGNVPAFRRKMQALLADDAKRKQLMAELGLDEVTSEGE